MTDTSVFTFAEMPHANGLPIFFLDCVIEAIVSLDKREVRMRHTYNRSQPRHAVITRRNVDRLYISSNEYVSLSII